MVIIPEMIKDLRVNKGKTMKALFYKGLKECNELPAIAKNIKTVVKFKMNFVAYTYKKINSRIQFLMTYW